MSNIKNKIIKVFEFVFKKNILIISKDMQKYLNAVKSSIGFWYCGDLYDRADIAYGININGIVEKNETELVKNILQQMPEDYVFLDIGANTGYYGIMSAYLYPKSKTYSFEPLEEHCNILRSSIYLNRLNNIEISQCGIGNKNEIREIYKAGSGTSFIKNFTNNNEEEVKIQIKKLDEVIKDKNIENIHFIKIDVEGFELEVLKGGQETINRFKPILFVEICKTKNNGRGIYTNPNFEETIDLLSSLGYSAHLQDGNSLRRFDKKESLKKGVFMFLFLHIDNHQHIKI